MQTLRQETATAETGTFYFSDGGVGAVRKGAGRPGNPGGIQEESRGNPRRIQGELGEQGKRAKRCGAEMKTRAGR